MGRIVLDKEKCKGCFLCISVCPQKVLKKDMTVSSKGFYTVMVDETRVNNCIGCAICAKKCPSMAILEVYK